jgi:phosphonoacetaldehyde hydrolase
MTIPPQNARAHREPYRGPLRAVILDWAGTTVDHGSIAPVRTLQRLFAERGVPISEEEARRDMGLPKRDHIRNILFNARVSAAWQSRFGPGSAEAEVENLFAAFVPLQLECLVDYSRVIDGVAEAVAGLRRRGLKIGSSLTRPRKAISRNARLLRKKSAADGLIPG